MDKGNNNPILEVIQIWRSKKYAETKKLVNEYQGRHRTHMLSHFERGDQIFSIDVVVKQRTVTLMVQMWQCYNPRKKLSVARDFRNLDDTPYDNEKVWVRLKKGRPVLSVFFNKYGDLRVLSAGETNRYGREDPRRGHTKRVMLDGTYRRATIKKVLTKLYLEGHTDAKCKKNLMDTLNEQYIRLMHRNGVVGEDKSGDHSLEIEHPTINTDELAIGSQQMMDYLMWYGNPQFVGDIMGVKSFQEYKDRINKWNVDTTSTDMLYWCHLIARRARKKGLKKTIHQMFGSKGKATTNAVLSILKKGRSNTNLFQAIGIAKVANPDFVLNLLQQPLNQPLGPPENLSIYSEESNESITHATRERKLHKKLISVFPNALNWIKDSLVPLGYGDTQHTMIRRDRKDRLFKDTIGLYERVLELELDPNWDWMAEMPRNLNDVHDYLTRIVNMAKKHIELKGWCKPEDCPMHNSTDGTYTYKLPEQGWELSKWGELLHHCIGIYDRQYLKRECLLVGVYEDDVLLATAQLMKKTGTSLEVVQLYGKYNKLLDAKRDTAIKKHLLKKKNVGNFFKIKVARLPSPPVFLG